MLLESDPENPCMFELLSPLCLSLTASITLCSESSIHFEFMLSDCDFILLHTDKNVSGNIMKNQSVCALSNLIISDHESPLLLCSICLCVCFKSLGNIKEEKGKTLRDRGLGSLL